MTADSSLWVVDEYTFENDKDINERIGERVTQLRESHHISQEEMEKSCYSMHHLSL